MVKRPAKPKAQSVAIDDLLRQIEDLRRQTESMNPTRTQAQLEDSSRTMRERRRQEMPRRQKGGGGRPPSDPDDTRSDRLGLRIHPDLRFELEKLARGEGMRLSMIVERLLIDDVNRLAGRQLLDKLGRYKDSR